MLKSLRTPKGRIFIGIVSNIALVAAWLAYDGSIAILPALMILFWIPVFSRQKEPVSPGSRRFMLASIAVGTLLFLVLAGIYVAQR